jgi:hypothetical protein
VVASIHGDMAWYRCAEVDDDDVLRLKIWGGACGAAQGRSLELANPGIRGIYDLLLFVSI